MKEISKYEVYAEKLSNICEENNLTYSIRRNAYPFLLTLKPCGGMDAQLSMLEDMENNEATGYISQDASIVFAYKDGLLTHKISGTFTISDSLLSKLKNLFKNLYFMWVSYYFRNSMETGLGPKVDTLVEAEDDEADYDDDDGIDEDDATALPYTVDEDEGAGEGFDEFFEDDSIASGLMDED